MFGKDLARILKTTLSSATMLEFNFHKRIYPSGVNFGKHIGPGIFLPYERSAPIDHHVFRSLMKFAMPPSISTLSLSDSSGNYRRRGLPNSKLCFLNSEESREFMVLGIHK